MKLLRRPGCTLYMVSGRALGGATLRAQRSSASTYQKADGGYKCEVVERLRGRSTASSGRRSAASAMTWPICRSCGAPGCRWRWPTRCRKCKLPRWQTTAQRRRGAVREFAEALLRARGDWDRLVDEYERAQRLPAGGQILMDLAPCAAAARDSECGASGEPAAASFAWRLTRCTPSTQRLGASSTGGAADRQGHRSRHRFAASAKAASSGARSRLRSPRPARPRFFFIPSKGCTAISASWRAMTLRS